MEKQIKNNKYSNLTKEEIAQINRAKTLPVIYDEDSPKLSKKILQEFRHYSKVNHANRSKITLSVRVSKATKNKLLSLGNGYTSIVNRLIEYALDNPSLLKKCL